MICDSTGSYKNLYVYDDFGNFRKKVENTTNHYYYTGQERDESPSGLYNLRARYYAPILGRFTQEDPIYQVSIGSCNPGDCDLLSSPPMSLTYYPEDNNMYLYCKNNPIMFTDITGEYCEPGKVGDFFIQDKFLGCNFSEACRNHDNCYGTCHYGNKWGKAICDQKFLKDMMKEANKAKWVFRKRCYTIAKIYYNAVVKYGGKAYNEAQKKACKKCK